MSAFDDTDEYVLVEHLEDEVLEVDNIIVPTKITVGTILLFVSSIISKVRIVYDGTTRTIKCAGYTIIICGSVIRVIGIGIEYVGEILQISGQVIITFVK